ERSFPWVRAGKAARHTTVAASTSCEFFIGFSLNRGAQFYHGPVHGNSLDPTAVLVLALAIILVAAKLGGDLAARLGQPSVLGELLAGVVLGNLTFVGFHGLDPIANSPSIEMLAEIGVL